MALGALLSDHPLAEAQKSQNFTVRMPVTFSEFIVALCKQFPELRRGKFRLDRTSKIATYPREKFRYGKDVFIIEKLVLQELSDGIYQIDIKYADKVFRPFVFIFTCFFLLFGIIPGIIFWMIFSKSRYEIAHVNVAFQRFRTLLADLEAKAGERHKSDQMTLPGTNQGGVEMTGAGDPQRRLTQLQTLLGSGVITKEEYDDARRAIIASI